MDLYKFLSFVALNNICPLTVHFLPSIYTRWLRRFLAVPFLMSICSSSVKLSKHSFLIMSLGNVKYLFLIRKTSVLFVHIFLKISHLWHSQHPFIELHFCCLSFHLSNIHCYIERLKVFWKTNSKNVSRHGTILSRGCKQCILTVTAATSNHLWKLCSQWANPGNYIVTQRILIRKWIKI